MATSDAKKTSRPGWLRRFLEPIRRLFAWFFTFRDDQGRIKLSRLVVVGTLVVLVFGGTLFFWWAWLHSGQPAPWRAGWWSSGWWAWLNKPTQEDWADAARTTATILAVIGVGGAALVGYRRQDINERAHDLDTQRHLLENLRRQDEQERELRSRFTTVAEQLSGKPSVRLAGAFALAALADDWHRHGNDPERQVAVSLMCAELRSAPRRDDPTDSEFRKTIIAIIKEHRPRLVRPGDESSWGSCRLDLADADLTGAGADLPEGRRLGARHPHISSGAGVPTAAR